MKFAVVNLKYFLWMLVVVQVSGNNNSQGNENASESGQGLQFSDNYKKVLADSSATLDLLNDSAEVNDDDELSLNEKGTGLKFDDFVPQKELQKSIGFGPIINDSLANVYKVPKSKNKKTISTIKHSSMKNEPVVNDFNSEFFFALNDGNLTSYDTYFHAFTHLYDHNNWNTNTFSLDVSKACLKDVQIYLNALHLSRDWAVKVSDASGKYRGLFYFENAFWLGSLNYCEEINSENEDNEAVPPLHFVVLKFIVKIETINHKVSLTAR
jgi:hypothetical protein